MKWDIRATTPSRNGDGGEFLYAVWGKGRRDIYNVVVKSTSPRANLPGFKSSSIIYWQWDVPRREMVAHVTCYWEVETAKDRGRVTGCDGFNVTDVLPKGRFSSAVCVERITRGFRWVCGRTGEAARGSHSRGKRVPSPNSKSQNHTLECMSQSWEVREREGMKANPLPLIPPTLPWETVRFL